MDVDTVDVFNKGEWSINEFPGWQQKIYEVARAYFFWNFHINLLFVVVVL